MLYFTQATKLSELPLLLTTLARQARERGGKLRPSRDQINQIISGVAGEIKEQPAVPSLLTLSVRARAVFRHSKGTWWAYQPMHAQRAARGSPPITMFGLAQEAPSSELQAWMSLIYV